MPGVARGLPATGGTASSTATRPSSTSSTRCSTSTPSGSRCPTTSRGGAHRLPHLPAVEPRWRQDHNGFSHQDPGFIDHVVNKKAEIIRVYLPPDANTLLATVDHCLQTRQYVNVIVAGKQPSLNYLSMEEAGLHCTRGLGIWEWASTDGRRSPMSCSGAAVTSPPSRAWPPPPCCASTCRDLKVRLVDVVDLMRLQDPGASPRPARRPVRRTVHARQAGRVRLPGYPWLIHRPPTAATTTVELPRARLQGGGHDHTPFDMVMLNDMDRYHLVMDVIDRARPGLDGRPPPPADGGRPPGGKGAHPGGRRGPAGDPRLGLARAERRACGSSSSTWVVDPQAAGARRGRPAGGRRRYRRADDRQRPAYLDGREPGRCGRPPGGARRARSSTPVLDDAVVAALDALAPLAPLHQPAGTGGDPGPAWPPADRARRWPASTRRSTPASPRRPRPTPCRSTGETSSACGASGSTGCPMPTQPGAPERSWETPRVA